jgi:DNA-binding PadR family transcriptional regulator
MCVIQYNNYNNEKGGGAMPKADDFQGLLSSYTTELRRGSLLLAVLGTLMKAEKQYGYELLKILNERGIDIDANTLYPLLRRLEAQGLLTGTWDTTESRPRKYFSVSEDGRALFEAISIEWNKLSDTVSKIITEAN